LRRLDRLPLWRNVRVRLIVILLSALLVALAVSTYGFNVVFVRSTSQSADSLLRARASSELSLLSLRRGRISKAETSSDALADSNVWIFGRGGVVEQPPARTTLDEAAVALARTPGVVRDVPSRDVRLYSTPIVLHGTREGILVTGVSLAPFEQAERSALLGSLALASLMLVLAGVAAWLLLKAALRPVVQMTEQAAAWSEFDLDRRFDRGEPHDELTLLAGTLDSMLDRIGASLRHERRFSAEVSHELRTPLARVIAEVDLALRRERSDDEYRETLALVQQNARQLARIVETLVSAAQHEANGTLGTADAYEVAAEAVLSVSELAARRHLTVRAEPPTRPLRLGLDRDLAERVLQPVLENACRYGTSTVRVVVSRHGSKISYVVEDDGPGVSDEERETIFEPGNRGRAARASTTGAGLGLSLSRRLARAASGDVTAQARSGGHFVITLPSA
jgi:two-component system, OmpR family, sensor kinase